MKRAANEEMKASYMDEIEQLQRILVKNRVNIHTKTLQKAFMMPEGFGVNQMVTEGRSYPSPAYGLMANPVTKQAGKKKKSRRVSAS